MDNGFKTTDKDLQISFETFSSMTKEEVHRLSQTYFNPDQLLEVICEELKAVRDEYGDDRRSEIQASKRDLSVEDLIADEQVVVTISNGGYAKTQPIDTYQAQRRGGRGAGRDHAIVSADTVAVDAGNHDAVDFVQRQRPLQHPGGTVA